MTQYASAFIKFKLNTNTCNNFGKILSFKSDLFNRLGTRGKLIATIGLVFVLSLFPMRQTANAKMVLVTSNCQEKNDAVGSEYQCADSIASALKLVQAGDTLWIDEGTYTENMLIYKKGTPQKPIIISALPDTFPVIDCGFIYFSSYSQYITVRGLEIKNKANESGIRLSSRSSNNTIEDCTIHDTGLNGIFLRGRNHTVSNNTIYATGLSDYMYKTHGIYVNSENSIIENNTISGSNNGNGIRSEGLNNDIIGNTIFDNIGYGISVFADFPTNNIVIADNTIYNNKWGIAILGGSADNHIREVFVLGNTIYDNEINMVVMGECYGVHLGNNEINNASHIQFFVTLNPHSDFTILNNTCSAGGYYLFNRAVYTNHNQFVTAINSIMP